MEKAGAINMTFLAENVIFAHHDAPVLKGISSQFQTGKLNIILGPNGAGKSTLLACLAGLLKADMGSITLSGEAVADMRPQARAKAIGLLPQEAETHWAITGSALVALGRYSHRKGFGLSLEDRTAIAEAMAETKTLQFATRPVSQLSGGERARVLMARVLAGKPQWILADEPLANLDLGHQFEMLALLQKQADHGCGVIAVLHDLHHAVRFADHVVLLHDGIVFAQGDIAKVMTPENLATVYGIDANLFTDEEGGHQLLIKGKTAP